jgi:prepilin-type N-terminal cleavage/methylation domain-containing protein
VHRRDAQRGFTIIELMIVVAIIAVLAIVVIPSFIKETKRSKSRSEVDPMVAELSTREDQYKLEQNAYLEAPACPPSSSSSGTTMTGEACATTAGQPWVLLRMQSSQSKLTCSYVVGTGAGGTAPTSHASWPSTWATTPPTPATSWYFILATCPDTEYLWKSWDMKTVAKDGH